MEGARKSKIARIPGYPYRAEKAIWARLEKVHVQTGIPMIQIIDAYLGPAVNLERGEWIRKRKSVKSAVTKDLKLPLERLPDEPADPPAHKPTEPTGSTRHAKNSKEHS